MLRALPLTLMRKQRFKVSVHVTVECPPAFVVHGIKRYFEARHNVLDITIGFRWSPASITAVWV